MTTIRNAPKLLTPQTVVVSDEGEVVVFKVGNSELRMHYESALQISQLIRCHAKRAKDRAGDKSRHWSAIANLHDANQE